MPETRDFGNADTMLPLSLPPTGTEAGQMTQPGRRGAATDTPGGGGLITKLTLNLPHARCSTKTSPASYH